MMSSRSHQFNQEESIERGSKNIRRDEQHKESRKADQDREANELEDGEDNRPKKDRLVIKKKGLGSEARAKLAAKADEVPQLLSPLEQQSQKYKQKKKDGRTDGRTVGRSVGRSVGRLVFNVTPLGSIQLGYEMHTPPYWVLPPTTLHSALYILRLLRGREEATLPLLNKFKSKVMELKTAPVEKKFFEPAEMDTGFESKVMDVKTAPIETKGAEPAEMEDDASGWLSHSLMFLVDDKRKNMDRNDDPNQYVVHDPLLEG